jgi:hypothetical protein
MDGQTVMHCSTCHDKHAVTVEEADRWREAARKHYGQAGRGFDGQ